jgi:hypothetical protein
MTHRRIKYTDYTKYSCTKIDFDRSLYFHDLAGARVFLPVGWGGSEKKSVPKTVEKKP